MEQGDAGARGHHLSREIARGHELVPGIAVDAEEGELLLDGAVRARSVGDEHDGRAAGPDAPERGGRLDIGSHTVMEDAPDIAQHHIELACELTKARDDLRRRIGCNGQKDLRRDCMKGMCAKDRINPRQGEAWSHAGLGSAGP